MKPSRYLLVISSLLLALIAPVNAQLAVDLIAFGSVWRYLDNNSNPGEDWKLIVFDDAGWAAGRAQLGYGDGDEATVVAGGPAGAHYITTYFRQQFNIDNPAGVSDLTVNLLRDDGAVVYLNGVEAFRDNMPGGVITPGTLAVSAVSGADENFIFTHTLNPSLLVSGPNVVAVEIHQSGTASSDISFDMQLHATVAAGPPVIVNQPSDVAAFPGGTATFSVEAGGGQPLNYQWDFNGSPIENATNSIYQLSGVTADNEGNYRVTITNEFGATASRKAALSILEVGDDVFQIVTLSASNSFAIEHNGVTGDDRGGIAVSPSTVFVTGDSSTARFSAVNLSGAANVGALYDSMVSDLRSGRVYVLANNGSPLSSSGGTANSLIEIDAETGALTANRLALSRPIDFGVGGGGSVGFFSGFGRIVVHNGARVFSIQLPSGVAPLAFASVETPVVDLGAMPVPAHQFSESWAYWGVAEFFGGGIWIDYVRDSQTIVRSHVPDGATVPLATFQNLSDMASFTVAPLLNRWYFHHEGTSQFHSGDETVGYAAASFVFAQELRPPQILSQPQGRTAGIGTDVEFRVAAFGYPLEYQWRFNGSPLDGETNETLRLAGVTTNTAGAYSVMVSNALGSVTSVDALLKVVQGAIVAVFDNPDFVDTSSGGNSAESDNVQATLGLFGHTAQPVSGISTALNREVVLFPEFEINALAPTLSAAERQALRNFVQGGGLIIVQGGAANVDFINSVYGFSMQVAGNSSSSYDRSPQAIGTPFNGGPPQVPSNDGTVPVISTSLPFLARSIYGNANETAVALIPYGAGKIIYLAWDWWNAVPIGSQDNGWADILAASVEARAPLPPTPPTIYSQPVGRTVLAGIDVTFNVGAVGSAPLSIQWLYNGSPLPNATNAALTLTSVVTNQSGSYGAVLSNAVGVVMSQVAVLVVHPSRGVVGYFTDGNPATTGPEASIQAAGFTPLRIDDITTFNFDRLSILMIDESSNSGVSSDLTGRITALSAWVSAGGKMIIHDRFVAAGGPSPHPLLVGAATTLLQRLEGADIDLVSPANTLVTAGPHGTLNNASLDGGSSSDHGYVLRDTLPAGARPILQKGPNGSQVVSFSYGFGGGSVYYATIPLDYYLEPGTGGPLGDTFRNVYTPNVIEYAAAFTAVGPPILLGGARELGVLAGGSLTLVSAVTGQPPFQYQWLFNGAVLAGATNSSLTLTGINSAEAGVYGVIIRNPAGSVTGTVATVTVVAARPFKILGLSATNCRVVDHDSLSGDDRGGIAVSSSQVFYSGDSSTVRFSAVDLSGGAALGRIYNALVSNLRTETAYSLAQGTGLIESAGGAVTALIQINSTDGSLTTNRIELSEPIPLGFDTGIFSGYDAIALSTGGNVYRVELPSGLVLNLGPMPGFQHSSCENWAFWGVTEYFHGVAYLVYVQDSGTIVRTRVPDGQTTVLASFSNLSDMCSFTFSPARNRWYYHYEGSGQFGGFNETLGYCGATWDRPPQISTIANRTTNEDATISIPFGVSDSETALSNLVVTANSSNSSLGLALSISGTGMNRVLTATPLPNVSGTSIISIVVTDELGQTAARSFLLTFNAVNDPPTAAGQSLLLTEDSSLAITLAGADVEGAPLSFAIVAPPAHGSLDGSAPSLIYTPVKDFAGQDSFTFRVNDGQLDSAEASVILNVTQVNDPPTAMAQTVTTREDTPVMVILTGLDPEQDPLTFVIRTLPAHGTLSSSPPDLIYTPAADYAGPDSFSFRVNDGQFDSVDAMVTLNVTPVNDAPVAAAQSLTGREDTALLATLSGMDREGDVLTYVIVTPPAHGTLNGIPPNLTYTPARDYNGSDSFIFKVNDRTVDSAPAVVAINLTSVNDPPTFVAGPNQSVQEDAGARTVSGWATEITSGPADEATQSVTFLVSHNNPGLFSVPPAISPSGVLTYMPAGNANGVATVTVTAMDNGGTADGGIAASPSQTFTISVQAVNDPPVAAAQSVSLEEDGTAMIILGGSDTEGDALVFTIVTPPEHGTLSGGGSARTYMPAANYHGADVFTFKVSDGQAESAPATVALTIRSINDAPVAVATVLGLIRVTPGSADAVLISSNNFDAGVVIDALRSYDIENDPLQYWWYLNTTSSPFGSGVLVSNRLEVGRHEITLLAADGDQTGTNTVPVEIIRPAAALEELAVFLNNSNLERNRKRPLLASLKASQASFDRGSFVSGVNQLLALQNKIRAQVAAGDPALALALNQSIQRIIDAMSGR